jgi:predicted small integral membrane protein
VQEQTRGWIAYALLAALFVVVIFLMIAGAIVAKGCYYSTDACAASKSTLEILTTITGLVFTPLVGLVGSVVGFYFGSKAGGNRG